MRVADRLPIPTAVVLSTALLLTLLVPWPPTMADAARRATVHAPCAKLGQKKRRRPRCHKASGGRHPRDVAGSPAAISPATAAAAAKSGEAQANPPASSHPAPQAPGAGPPPGGTVANPLTEGERKTEGEAPFRFFSPTSVWNREVPAAAPLDPDSGPIIGAFEAEVGREIAARTGPWIDTTAYSVPIYRVAADQPTVPVALAAPSPGLGAAFAAVPLPPDARPAAGTDGHLVVWQPATDRLWEFWRLVDGAAGWRASWGGTMEDVQESPGVYGPGSFAGATRWWGASASSLSIAGGLITLEDLELGVIDHALAISVPDVRAGVYASPAQRTDGTSPSPLSLPEGAHLRLDPRLDLGSLHLAPLTLMIARAAQRYGIVVRDGSPSVASFYAQDPTPTGTDPYHGPGGWLEGRYPSQLLASFPWRHLELLRMELHRVNRTHHGHRGG